MRSLSGRLFVSTLIVSLTALAIGAWLVQRAVRTEFDREVSIVRRVSGPGGERIEEEVTRDATVPTPVAVDGPGAGVADALNRRLVIALAIVLGGATLMTGLLSRRVLRPVSALRQAAERWSRGDFTARVSIDGDDELAALGRAFNDLAHRLEAQERLKRDLTNDVAHELRTPLTNLRCHVEALADSVVTPGPDTWTALASDVASLERLVRDLGELAQAEARQLRLHPESLDVGELLQTLAAEAGPRAARAGVSLTTAVDPRGVRGWADRARLHQVLRNLLDNAFMHTPSGGRIELSAAAGGSDQGSRSVVIEVSDTGTGIAPEHLPHLFDRFYRADPSRSRQSGGAGLGLAIARQIVLASGGEISVRSRPGAGAVFRVILPAASSQDLHNRHVQ